MAKLKTLDSYKAIEGKVYRIGHNTMQWIDQNVRYTKLHSTTIARENLDTGKITVFARGYHTRTTQDRLNQVLMPHGFGVSSRHGTWIVRRWRDDLTVEFFDGMVLPDVFDIFN